MTKDSKRCKVGELRPSQALTTFGVAGMLTRWPVYALAAAAVTGTLLEQSALHVGPLSVSQLLLVMIDPLASIILGIWLFGERASLTARRRSPSPPWLSLSWPSGSSCCRGRRRRISPHPGRPGRERLRRPAPALAGNVIEHRSGGRTEAKAGQATGSPGDTRPGGVGGAAMRSSGWPARMRSRCGRPS